MLSDTIEKGDFFNKIIDRIVDTSAIAFNSNYFHTVTHMVVTDYNYIQNLLRLIQKKDLFKQPYLSYCMQFPVCPLVGRQINETRSTKSII